MSIDFFHATAAACMAAVVKILARASVRWLGCGPGVHQRIYFANHTGHLDALVLWAALGPEARALTRPVAARDYWTAGPARRYLAEKVFRAVMIDRRHVSAHAHNPIEPLLTALDDGRSSLILSRRHAWQRLRHRAFQRRTFPSGQTSTGHRTDPHAHRKHRPHPPAR